MLNPATTAPQRPASEDLAAQVPGFLAHRIREI